MFLKRVNLRLLAQRAVPTEGQKRDPDNLPHARGMALPAFVGHRSIPRIHHLRAPPIAYVRLQPVGPGTGAFSSSPSIRIHDVSEDIAGWWRSGHSRQADATPDNGKPAKRRRSVSGCNVIQNLMERLSQTQIFKSIEEPQLWRDNGKDYQHV
jgi:hypothetical protein